MARAYVVTYICAQCLGKYDLARAALTMLNPA